MSEFASRWPDVRLWAIARIRPTTSGVEVSAERQALAQQVVVSVVPQQLETAVSRFYLVNIEGWDSSDKNAAADLASDAAFQIESAPRDSSPVVKAEINSGPNENRDPDSGEYSYSVTVLVTIHRLP